jgi:hypothetical protein
MGGLFRLRNVTIVGYFYYLKLLKLLHVSVVLPSSSRNILGDGGFLFRLRNVTIVGYFYYLKLLERYMFRSYDHLQVELY